MAGTHYRVTVNGFWCHNETWDDMFNWDGKHDEVFVDVNVKTADSAGNITLNFDSESELMGDTWQLPGRVQAGSASDRGGIVTGDKFPSARPWQRSGPLNIDRVPPYMIWEGELPEGQMVMLTPTIWEWDPGAGFWDGWLSWQVATNEKYGTRAKEIFGKIWPVTIPIFDAVSLGIETLGSLAGLWSPPGKSMRRPIGLQRNPADPDGSLFNPTTIALNSETAAYLSTSNLQGYGTGIVELRYVDDPDLHGVYSLFVQIEQVSDDGWADAGHANGVVSMTYLDGRLFGATNDNVLWMRDAVTNEINWSRLGHANNVVGMAATGGRLFCATTDNQLWTREATAVDVNWDAIGHANGVVGMAALDGSLYCVTNDGGLWMRPPVLANIDWTRVGNAAGVTDLAAAGGTLYGLLADGMLCTRPAAAADAPWQESDPAPEVRALAASGQRLFGATTTNRLLTRLR
jgi:hypothetical protein